MKTLNDVVTRRQALEDLMQWAILTGNHQMQKSLPAYTVLLSKNEKRVAND